MRSIIKAATAVAAGVLAAGLIGDSSRADTILNSNFSGGGAAYVTFTDQSSSEHAGVGPFQLKATDTFGSPTGAAFDAYCATLNVTNTTTNPVNINVTNVWYLSTMTNTNNTFLANSAYGDAGNRLAYLLTNYTSISNTGTLAERQEALQLAVWKTLDQNFAYTGFTPSGSATTVNTLVTAYTTWATNGYNPSTSYGMTSGDEAVYLKISGAANGGNYQDLITVLHDSNTFPNGPGSVPEPASVVSALIGLGAAGLFAGRRVRSKAA